MKLPNLFSNPPVLAKYLFIVLAAVLDILAIRLFMHLDNNNIEQSIRYATYSFVMFIDAAVMLICAFGINKKKKQFYQFAVVILVLNIILTVFGQLGIVEILFILINVANLYVLFTYRAEFIES